MTFTQVCYTETNFQGFSLQYCSVVVYIQYRSELAYIESNKASCNLKQLAIVPEEFKSLVQKSVDQFFNQTIYDNKLAEYTPEQIGRLVQSKVKFLKDN